MNRVYSPSLVPAPGPTRVTVPAPRIQRHSMPVVGVVRAAFAVAGRNLIAFRRVPALLVFTAIQPIVFVLLLRYVFGGAASIPGVSYVDYLMPGIFVQTVVFGATVSAIGLATDVKSGLQERFRSLPMASSAVLAGRTLADLMRAVSDPESAQAATFPVIAPLVFASSAFVPVSMMPGWLQAFAMHQPVSITASAVRALVLGGPTTSLVLQ